MKMKRILSLVLAIALMAVVFVGCSDNKSDDSDSSSTSGTTKTAEIEDGAKLKLWGPNAALTTLKKQAKAFEEAHSDKNVSVEVVPMEEDQAGTQVLNDPDAAADVFGFASDQLTKLTMAKALMPLYKDYENKVAENHSEAAVNTARGDYEGSEVVFAFPETDNGYYLVYDKSVVTDEDAKTLEGVLAACKKAGRKFVMDAGTGYYSCMFAFTGGLALDGVEGEAQDTQKFNDYDEAKVVASMKAFGELISKYKGTFSKAAVSNISAGFSESPRKVAAGIDGTWDASANEKALGDDYGVVKLPTINIDGTDTDIIGMIGYKYLGVNNNTKYPEASMALADYLADTDCQAERLKDLGWTPTNKNVDVADNPAIQAMQAEGENFVIQADIIQAFWDPFANLGNQLTKDKADLSDAALKKLLTDTLNNVNG
ncbi:MAG: hypothetical protein IJV39_06535 [Ruminococcus sp.]|nr:hypothetical protein [Ruminococcus sp.]